MNYLCHFILARHTPEFLAGVFAADEIKGNLAGKHYPEEFKKGILFHRYCDTYTDHHGITSEIKNLLKGSLGRWAGVAVDIYYDHFLARYFHDFHHMPLQQYSDFILSAIYSQRSYFTFSSLKKWFYLRSENLPYGYCRVENLQVIFRRMEKRIGYENNLSEGYQTLLRHYHTIESFSIEFIDNAIKEITPS